MAASEGPFRAWRAVAALVVALALQVGVNYANDYQDGTRGTDRERVGPTRLVASGLAAPAEVRAAAVASFALAAAAGAALAIVVSPWLLLVAVSNQGPGIFDRVSYIQRLNTEGGNAPSVPGDFLGQIVKVPYTADYVFYRKSD